MKTHANIISRRRSDAFSTTKERIRKLGFFVYGVNDFSNVMETYHNVQPEIVIMDVQLPKYDGFYWCRQIRQVSNVPILFLSSRDNPMDQVMSMELGADDYMQKPFHTNVLIAKLQAIYRRVYQFGAEERRTLNWQDALVIFQKIVFKKAIKSFIYLKLK